MNDHDLTDDAFVTAFLAGALSPTAFHHRDHLRLAWCLVRRSGPVGHLPRGDSRPTGSVAAATATIAEGIRRFAAQHGQADKYHETLTQFWVRVVSHHIDTHPDITTFDRFLATFPRLLDKDLPFHHWRRETMQLSDARARWVEPDLLALPA